MEDFDLNDPQEFELAKLWTVAMLLSLKEGAMWVVPRSKSIYVIDHKNKTLMKMTGTPEPSITRVVTALGWKVVDGPQEENIL